MGPEDDNFDDYGDEESNEPIGSCDECDQNVDSEDAYIMDGTTLCGRCHWIAMGCPEPGREKYE